MLHRTTLRKDAKAPRPIKELKGFEKVTLQSGETKHISVPLDGRSFAYNDTQERGGTSHPENVASSSATPSSHLI